MHRRLAILFVFVAHAAGLQPLGAHEFSAMGGTMGTGTLHGISYAWQLEYRQPFARNFAWSASWINEGHAKTHHRDGLAGQAWATLLAAPEEFSVAFGAGGFHYSDTVLQPDNSSTNVHGWTPIYSLSATYYTRSPWFGRITANHINRAAGLQTNTLVAGIGYQLDWRRPEHSVRNGSERTTSNEFTAFFGKSIVNTSISEEGDARVFEYRKGIGRCTDWTVSWFNEGDPRIIRRNGVATQVWLVNAYLDRRLALGLGVGPYFYFDRKHDPIPGQDSDWDAAALLSPTASYRFGDRWLGRLTWNRVVSDYNRDADVIVLGVGYRWGRHE